MIVDQFCIRAVPLELIKSLQIASLPPEPSLLSVQGPEELTEPLQHAPIEPDPSLQIDSQEPIPLLQFDRCVPHSYIPTSILIVALFFLGIW